MRIKDTRFLIIDTETTGLEYTADKVVDIACVELVRSHVTVVYESLVNPGFAIPPEASAVHHLTDKLVKDAPLWGEVLAMVKTATFKRNTQIVAHNAAFDSNFLTSDFTPWLCTYRLARHLWPELKSHSNQFLRYYFKLDISDVGVHRAKGDAIVTAHLLRLMLNQFPDDMEVEDLVSLANSPIYVSKMPFGKYRGEDMTKIPHDYFVWVLKNVPNLDKDLRITIETLLER